MVVLGSGGGEFAARGFIDAYDVQTGERRWRRYTVPGAGEAGVETWAGESWRTGGALATGGGVIFTGNQEGYALALDETSGEVLWKFQTGSAVRSQPITFEIKDRQYVAIGSGAGGNRGR